MTNQNSKIEWTDTTWNPATGCDKVSPGCDGCYAEAIAKRFAGTKAFPNGFDLTLHPERMHEPLRWRKPRRVFVNSMSDLFHDGIPDDFIAEVFAVMACAPAHTFQVLTKRHGRMRSLMRSTEFYGLFESRFLDLAVNKLGRRLETWSWPVPNVWLGVSVEDQKWADIRIPALIQTPAAVRFLSCEPLLGPLDINRYLWLVGASTAGPFYDYAGNYRGGGGIGGQTITFPRARDLHWIIAGAESGGGARPMDENWVRSLRDQCSEADVPFFYKQNAAKGKKLPTPELDGRRWVEFPEVSS